MITAIPQEELNKAISASRSGALFDRLSQDDELYGEGAIHIAYKLEYHPRKEWNKKGAEKYEIEKPLSDTGRLRHGV